MELFQLPISTRVQKVIPKNAFDQHTSAKEKKLISEKVQRITWLNKISSETTNLPFTDIQEIQIFKIELKVKEVVAPILNLIDKAIPYRIIFVVQADDEFYLSTSVKHEHPTKKATSVIDWTFSTDWLTKTSEKDFSMKLAKSIDAVYEMFCLQLRPNAVAKSNVVDLIEYEKKVEALKKEIAKLRGSIESAKQFNYKVEQNILLQAKEKELENWTRQNLQ
jgi:hypothetical protein